MYYPVVLSFAMHHICNPSDAKLPRTAENDWERLRMTENDCVFF